MEDAQMYLPRKAVTGFRKGQIIFDQQHASAGLYLIVQGRVKVAIPKSNGSETLADVFSAGEFFGESALLSDARPTLRAVALDPVSLMWWTSREIEDQAGRQPKLGIALLQMLAKRSLDYQTRLQDFALDKTPERVVRALLSFGGRFGTRTEAGNVHVPPLTHQVISEYVGTSREIITFQMSHLRRKGLLQYSRKGIQFDPSALREHLRTPSEASGSPSGEQESLAQTQG